MLVLPHRGVNIKREAAMERDEFIDTLKREGFEEIVTVTRDRHGTLDDHAHPFEAKALMISALSVKFVPGTGVEPVQPLLATGF